MEFDAIDKQALGCCECDGGAAVAGICIACVSERGHAPHVSQSCVHARAARELGLPRTPRAFVFRSLRDDYSSVFEAWVMGFGTRLRGTAARARRARYAYAMGTGSARTTFFTCIWAAALASHAKSVSLAVSNCVLESLAREHDVHTTSPLRWRGRALRPDQLLTHQRPSAQNIALLAELRRQLQVLPTCDGHPQVVPLEDLSDPGMDLSRLPLREERHRG